MKKRIIEIDFIKTISAFGIISFHFAFHIKSEKKFFFMSRGTTYVFYLLISFS